MRMAKNSLVSHDSPKKEIEIGRARGEREREREYVSGGQIISALPPA